MKVKSLMIRRKMRVHHDKGMHRCPGTKVQASGK